MARFGFGTRLRSRLLAGSSVAAILSLFAASEQGVWFELSDLTTLYQNSAGTTAAVVGQPVGLMLDKSRGLALGAELLGNGGFEDGSTGWSVLNNDATHVATFSSGRLRFQSDTTTPQLLVNQTGKLVVGRWYKITVNIFSVASGTVKTNCFNVDTGFPSTPGAFTFYGLATSTTFSITRNSANVDITLDSISVKELAGNHAYQTTAASRPILARHPFGGRRNEINTRNYDPTVTTNLTLSGDVAGVLSVVSDWAALAAAGLTNLCPNGQVYKLDNSAGATASRVRVNNQLTMGASTWTFSIYGRGNGTASLDVNAGTWAGGGSPALTSAYQRLSSTGTTNTSINQFRINAPAGAVVYFVLMQAEIAGAVTAPQATASIYDVTEAGVADCYYLAFDGVDDFMVTPSIDFTATDEMTVFAGVRKLSDAAVGVLAELSANYSANAGAFALLAPLSPTAAEFAFAVSGDAVNTGYRATGYAAPITATLTGIFDLAGATRATEVMPYVSGVTPGALTALGSASAGAGSFGNYPLYIGRRAGATLPFNGHLYGLIVRGKLSTAAEIAAAESYIATKTGVTL